MIRPFHSTFNRNDIPRCIDTSTRFQHYHTLLRLTWRTKSSSRVCLHQQVSLKSRCVEPRTRFSYIPGWLDSGIKIRMGCRFAGGRDKQRCLVWLYIYAEASEKTNHDGGQEVIYHRYQEHPSNVQGNCYYSGIQYSLLLQQCLCVKHILSTHWQ